MQGTIVHQTTEKCTDQADVGAYGKIATTLYFRMDLMTVTTLEGRGTLVPLTVQPAQIVQYTNVNSMYVL
jgi:hypothetical protein